MNASIPKINKILNTVKIHNEELIDNYSWIKQKDWKEVILNPDKLNVQVKKYLDEENLAWAKASGEGEVASDKVVHRDSNGVILEMGDTVVLIKDLPVRGSSMVAKRGTAVRRISLVHDNAEHIEGKVDGIQIVILTKFVKKMA